MLGNWDLYTVISPPVSSGSAEFLRVLYYYVVQSLRDGVTLAGRVCVVHTLSIGTKTPSEPYSKNLRDEVTPWVECGPRYTLDRIEGLTWLLFQVPSGWGHPFRVEFLAT